MAVRMHGNVNSEEMVTNTRLFFNHAYFIDPCDLYYVPKLIDLVMQRE